MATSSPSALQVEPGMSLQRESFDFSLEVPPAAPVVSESSSGLSKKFDRSVRRTGKGSLEIVVSSSAPRLGPKDHNKLINKPTNKSNGGPNNKSPIIKVKVGPKNNKLINKPDNKLNKINKPTKTKSGGKHQRRLAQPSSKVARECGLKSLWDDNSSASDDEAASPKTSCRKHRSKRLCKSAVTAAPPGCSSIIGEAQVLPSPAANSIHWNIIGQVRYPP